MNSQSLLYVIVIPITWFAIRGLRKVRSRQALILLTSYILYASWGIGFLGLLLLSSIMNFGVGRLLKSSPSVARLWLGIIGNVALLGSFKYAAELMPLLSHTRSASAISRIVLPIGISFWTFQAMSYLMDTYRGEDLDPSFMEFLLYMAFWPTVLSGPICRLPSLLPQFRSTANATVDDVTHGMDRICIGIFMVALGGLLANGIHLDQGVDHAFQISPAKFSGPDVWCLAFAYGFDLFFNFAGYSHIVIGAARLFGFELAENFNGPYISTTPSEFWTRWHMSLSFWIRDYLFLPLAMMNRSKFWLSCTLVISMLIFGLWHKGTVLLAVWGIYHGILLVFHRQWQELKRRMGWSFVGDVPSLISWFITFATICLGWIFFRSNTLAQAFTMLHSVLEIPTYSRITLPDSLYFLLMVLALGYFGTIELGRLLAAHLHTVRIPTEMRFALYSMAIYLGIFHSAQTQAFAYFKF